jgi:hypothetical protein
MNSSNTAKVILLVQIANQNCGHIIRDQSSSGQRARRRVKIACVIGFRQGWMFDRANGVKPRTDRTFRSLFSQCIRCSFEALGSELPLLRSRNRKDFLRQRS